MLGVRGAAIRRLDEWSQAEQDFHDALEACSCEKCCPRIRRRQGALCVFRGQAKRALLYANAAIKGFQELFDPVGGGRALTVRASAYWIAEDIPRALRDARRAREMIPVSDGAHFIANLVTLACILTHSGKPKDWHEALTIIQDAKSALRSLNGGEFRILKLKLRWVEILAELQNEIGEKHAKRLHDVFRELVGLGLKVPKHQVEKEMQRAEKAARKDPFGLAAVVADMSLAGARPAWIEWAAKKAHGYQPDGSPIAEGLNDLRKASQRGQDLRPFALSVRAHCSAAPALPPRLQAAA